MTKPYNPATDPALALEASPLAQADLQSLNELMQRDPLALSDVDLEAMVALYREKRKEWEQQEQVKASLPGKSKTPPRPGLGLEDLGL